MVTGGKRRQMRRVTCSPVAKRNRSDQVIAFILAAALGVADFSDPAPCSDEAARHIAANYSVCSWEPPPPFSTNAGTSDYRGRGGGALFLARPEFEWSLRDREVLPLDQVPMSSLETEKELFGSYFAGCQTPQAAAVLGVDEAGRRGDHALECWQFLDEEEVRRSAPEIED
jgi:hypothetical protein